MNAHPQFDEDFALFEIGILDGSDKAEFDSHTAACAECRANLAAARAWVPLLALAVPAAEPRAIVRERILESFRERAGGRLESTRPAPTRGRLPAPFWSPLWVGLCLILVVASAWLAVANRRLSGRLSALELTRSQLEATSRELELASVRARAALDVLTAPETVQVDLAPGAARPVPHGKVFYNSGKGLLFYATNLRRLPADRTYELWLIPASGAPINAGVFNTDALGNGEVILPPLPLGLTAKVFAVTVEPPGGVPAPTGPKVLIGAVS